MSKVKLNLAITLDGYIARLDNTVDYLQSPTEAGIKSFNEFLDSVDTIVMGSTSYDQLVELEKTNTPFKNHKKYVLTSQEYMEEDNTVFVDKELEELLPDILLEAKKDVWVFGGAKVVKQFIEIDAIDEFIITIAPTILGTGIPLFLFTRNELDLELVKTETSNGLVTLCYIRKKQFER